MRAGDGGLSREGTPLSWNCTGDRPAGCANSPKRKGFELVLHCRNVAVFGAMPTPDAIAREFAPTGSAAPSGEGGAAPPAPPTASAPRPREIGGQSGPEPTRYGDWERAGRCIDF